MRVRSPEAAFRTRGVVEWKGILLAEKIFPGGERGKVSMNVMMPSGEAWCLSHCTVVFRHSEHPLGNKSGRNKRSVYAKIAAFWKPPDDLFSQ